MNKLLVAGGGTMGKGIALCAAQHGFAVTVYLRNAAAMEKVRHDLESSLANAVVKNKLTQDEKDAALERIGLTNGLPDPAGFIAVIEAIAESMSEKQLLFYELARHFSENTLIASTTSSLSITGISSKADFPERCIGMHFFNPVPVMRLVEVIRGARTSDATHARAIELAKVLNKTPVSVNDNTGFVVSRLLVPMINDAAFLLGESVAGAEDIDLAMVLGANHPMGPLALGDRIGLDVCLNVLEILFDDTKDSRYRPAPLLKKMVRAGLHGRKSGQGFFVYR